MRYTLTFKFHGKTYSNYQVVPVKAQPNQYEAVACGLLLWKIEHEKLSRQDQYIDLCLIESDESIGEVNNPVWTCPEYTPISMEVK